MRDAVARVAHSRLRAALLLAALAPTMRHAVGRAASGSGLDAALFLAAFASAMSDAVRRASTSRPLGAAIQLTLPPAHGAPPGSRWFPPKSSSTAARHAQPSPTPLSALNAPLVFSDTIHTTVAVREQVNRCSMSRARWSTALGRGTHGGFVVGQAGQGLLRTLHRRVRRLLARRAASPNPDGWFECTHSTPTHGASTARRRATLECTCCSEGGSALRVGRDAPSVSKP
jgi:hypothetical protein